ncbi:hypothetical protein [Enterococcus hirae]|uniref:hypothetical protein n=1 Tax=Enterococcus hirae TaxID=1354 RepID=UPI0013778D0E|nr:hypothetical protein [Enterococcus hirae]NBA40611.1 hypothetical protein [Enterococcus hirae]NBA56631.1 hypothetical protein [Enterococcus hirae]
MKKVKIYMTILFLLFVGGLFNSSAYGEVISGAKTGVSVSFERKIIPDKLPGNESNGNYGLKLPYIASKKDTNYDTLVKTGSIVNNWSIWGSVIIVGVLFIQCIRLSKVKKEA